jgi:hypothetical protein
VTITDDDAPPTVSVLTAAVPEGTSGTSTHTIGVGLSVPSGKPITVNFATNNTGTATSPADFSFTSGGLSFAAGNTTKTFNLTVVGDYADEPDETVAIGFSSPVNVSLPGSAQAVTIVDDDPACVAADPITTNTNLGTRSGDTNGAPLQQISDIDPCGDVDWYRFTLTENNNGDVFLSARVTLQSVANDSPQSGDIDLCARVGTTGSPVCSNANAGITEVIDVCAEDHFFPPSDDTTEFYMMVDGFNNAVNNYTLTITGNTTLTPGVPKVSSGAC